jgi:hypothetical protein
LESFVVYSGEGMCGDHCGNFFPLEKLCQHSVSDPACKLVECQARHGASYTVAGRFGPLLLIPSFRRGGFDQARHKVTHRGPLTGDFHA